MAEWGVHWGMRWCWIVGVVLLGSLRVGAQTDDPAGSYRMRVVVDEVSVTFHASDAHGLPVNDLKLEELRLFDNGKPPRGLLALEAMRGLPLRAGILMDRSPSMRATRGADREIALRVVQGLLGQQGSRGFVMQIDSTASLGQGWTSDTRALGAAIRSPGLVAAGALPGTALFDALYKACLNQFGHLDVANGASANFILLFSDGEDNASRVTMAQAVDMCHRSNTAVYGFRARGGGDGSDGPRTLAALTGETGGKVFHDDGTEAEIAADLAAMEADLRSQYRLVFRPRVMVHDGSFHSLALLGPERASNLVVRSGYYAPVR